MTKARSDNETATEVAIPVVKLTDAELRAVSDSENPFSDAMALLTDKLGAAPADASSELGTGFTLVEDKRILIGRPMILMAWSFNAGDQGQFASVTAVTEDGGKYIFNDGGTGICAQLEAYTERTKSQGGLVVRRGLRVSEYSNEHTDSGRTYYLDTSA